MSAFKTKKSLGQHFLNSPHALTAMVEAGAVTSKDTVIEIGPGEGVLTKEILKTGAQVIVIETDDRLIPILEETFTKEVKEKQLTIIHKDVRGIDYKAITKKPYKVIANIPYYITGEIIQSLLSSKHKPSSITLLIQKEVAERITTRKESKESILSISIKAYGQPKYIKTVKKTAFYPPPKIDSAILHIGNITENNFKKSNISEKRFFKVMKQGFAHKRKRLQKNLEGLVTKEKFSECGQSENVRAEELCVEDWLCLSK